MRRVSCPPRENWQKTVESQGMFYHTADGVPYWDGGVIDEGRVLLFLVEQEGRGACHTGQRTCFFRAFGDGSSPGPV